MRSAARLLTVAALLLAAGSARAADTYPIKIDRPVKAGDAADVHFTCEASQKLTMSAPGADPMHQDQTTSGDLTARMDVLHATDKGDADQFTLTVKSFTDGEHQALAEPGAVLTVKRSATDLDITSSGAPVSDDAKKILSLIFDKIDPTAKTTDDDVFGTTTPRKVGDAWPINTVAAAQGLGKMNITVAAEDLAGETKLVSVDQAPAGPVLHITASFKAKNLKPEVPPGATLGECNLVAAIDTHIPAEVTALPVDQSLTMDIHMAFNTPNGGVVADIHASKKQTVTLIKK